MKKTAVVTGGSRGIGFAIARQLGLDGFQVVIMDRSSQKTYQRNYDQLTADGTSWLFFQGDIGKDEDRQKLIHTCSVMLGGIHVLVNNAGVAPLVRRDLLEMTEESFDRVISVNTKGTMFLTQEVAKQMIKQPKEGKKRGTIVNISSCSAYASSVGRGEYCISKAGVSMLTKLYADRLASEEVFVYEVRPGVIDTDMTNLVRPKYDKMIEDGNFPIRRWGTPEDVAGVVSAFCSENFLYTTGNYIDVDGGFHIQRL